MRLISSLRRTLRWIIAVSMYHSGVLKVFRLLASHLLPKRAVVLCYHRVFEVKDRAYDYSQSGIVSSAKYFHRQIEHLRRYFDIISMQTYVTEVKQQRQRPVCVVTFEDGWSDNYYHAYPLLKAHNIPAMIFLTTEFVERGTVFWHTKLIYLLMQGDLSRLSLEDLDRGFYPGAVLDSLAKLGKLRRPVQIDDVDGIIEALKVYDQAMIDLIVRDLSHQLGISLEPVSQRRFSLTWSQVLEMAHGGIEFGCHGHTHRILTRLTSQGVWEEAVRAKEILEARLGSPAIFFLCPNGNSNSTVRRTLTAAGFRYVFPCRNGGGNNSLGHVKHINVHDGSCTSPLGRFSESLFAFELSGIKETFLRRGCKQER